MNYLVRLNRVEYSIQDVVVEATNKEEAEEKALESDWIEYSQPEVVSGYDSVHDIVEHP